MACFLFTVFDNIFLFILLFSPIYFILDIVEKKKNVLNIPQIATSCFLLKNVALTPFITAVCCHYM